MDSFEKLIKVAIILCAVLTLLSLPMYAQEVFLSTEGEVSLEESEYIQLTDDNAASTLQQITITVYNPFNVKSDMTDCVKINEIFYCDFIGACAAVGIKADITEIDGQLSFRIGDYFPAALILADGSEDVLRYTASIRKDDKEYTKLSLVSIDDKMLIDPTGLLLFIDKGYDVERHSDSDSLEINIRKKITVEMTPVHVKSDNKTYKQELSFSGNDFFTNNYNPNLAEICVTLSSFANGTGNSKLRTFLTSKLEFGNIKSYDYSASHDIKGCVGHTFAEKNIDGKRVIFIVLRSTVGYEEWQSNFDFGEKSGDLHGGFNTAARGVIKNLDTYIGNGSLSDGDNLRFIITGHSRGAGVGNIVAALLSDKYGAEKVSAYTFAAPQLTNRENADSYSNIFNFIMPNDFITRGVYFDGWGRFGVDIFPSSEEQVISVLNKEIVGRTITLKPVSDIEDAVKKMKAVANNKNEHFNTKWRSVPSRKQTTMHDNLSFIGAALCAKEEFPYTFTDDIPIVDETALALRFGVIYFYQIDEKKVRPAFNKLFFGTDNVVADYLVNSHQTYKSITDIGSSVGSFINKPTWGEAISGVLNSGAGKITGVGVTAKDIWVSVDAVFNSHGIETYNALVRCHNRL